MSDIREKMRKLLELAQRGVGGEKDNAMALLNRALQKHGLRITDLDDTLKKKSWFCYRGGLEKTLLHQIIVAVSDRDVTDVYVRPGKSGSNGFMLTPDQAAEAELRWRIYRRAFREEQDLLLHAFIQKNRIFPATAAPGSEEPRSKEEQSRIERMLKMSEGVRNVPIRREIGRPAR